MTDSTPPRSERPLSPHLQVYAPQLTSVTSILHRFTGVVNSVGLIVLALLIYAVAFNINLYVCMINFFDSIVGKIVLTGFAAALCYHFMNGVRHLKFDTGCGLELKKAYMLGYIVLVTSGALTLLLAIRIWGS